MAPVQEDDPVVVKGHLHYTWYLIRHKWFVLIAGLRVGAPLWRLIIHDWSKLTPAEWGPYVHSFYGPRPRSEEVKAEFRLAWLHHQHCNPHHWQHWLLHEDEGGTRALPIPDKMIREMVADWMGAGRAIKGEWEVLSWYSAHEHKMVLHPATRERVEELLSKHG